MRRVGGAVLWLMCGVTVDVSCNASCWWCGIVVELRYGCENVVNEMHRKYCWLHLCIVELINARKVERNTIENIWFIEKRQNIA